MYDVDQIAEALDALPPKLRAASMRSDVARLAPHIRGGLEKSYSVDDICELLGGYGMTIKPSTLRAYLREFDPRPKRERPRKSRAKRTSRGMKSPDGAANDPPIKRGKIRSAEEL